MSAASPLDDLHLAVYSESNFMGGGEIALGLLLGKLDDRINVTVVGTNAAVAEAIAAVRAGSRVRLIKPMKGRRDLAGMSAHLRLVRELRPDILQTNGNPWVCQYALAAGVLTRGVRTVALHHAMPPPHSRGQLWRIRGILRRVDAHVSVFSEGARMLERWIGLATGTVRVIHNGVPDAPITPAARPASGPIVGTMGRLEPEKGLDVLLRALQALPDVTAVLLGDGQDRERLQRLAHKLGVEGRVLMPGWEADPRPWLPSFDVFVMPSRTEALPLAVIEAMLASRPVVASRVGGVSEVVLDNRTGVLVPPENPAAVAGAVRSLLQDPDRRERMGKEGRRFAKTSFSLEKMVRSYESLYEELIGPYRHGPVRSHR